MPNPIGSQSHPKVRQALVALRAMKEAAPLLRLHRQRPILRELARHPVDTVADRFFQQHQLSQKIIDASRTKDIRTFSDFLSDAFPNLRVSLAEANRASLPPPRQLLWDALGKITALVGQRFLGFFHKEGMPDLKSDFILAANELEGEVARAYSQAKFDPSQLSNPDQLDGKYLDLIDSGFQIGAVRRLLMMNFTKTRKKIRTLSDRPLPEPFFEIATWRGWGNPLMYQAINDCLIPPSFCRSMQVLLVLEAVTMKQSVGILAGQSNFAPPQAEIFRDAMENLLGIVSRAIER